MRRCAYVPYHPLHPIPRKPIWDRPANWQARRGLGCRSPKGAQPISNRRIATPTHQRSMWRRLALPVPRRSRTVSELCRAWVAMRASGSAPVGGPSQLARGHNGYATHRRRRSGERSAVQNRMQKQKRPVQHYVGEKSITGVLGDSDPQALSPSPTRRLRAEFLNGKGFVRESQACRSTPLLYHSAEVLAAEVLGTWSGWGATQDPNSGSRP